MTPLRTKTAVWTMEVLVKWRPTTMKRVLLLTVAAAETLA
jgi:hypothetical protein